MGLPDDEKMTARVLATEVRRRLAHVFFVAPRVLRRAIRREADLPWIGFRVPHGESLVISSDRVREHLESDELAAGLAGGDMFLLPARLILLPMPADRDLRGRRQLPTLARLRRQLFHAQVEWELLNRLPSGSLGRAAIRQRIDSIGQTAFDEVRTTLRREDRLLAPKDDRLVYIEFAATYLELLRFAPSELRAWFPTICYTDILQNVTEILQADLDLDHVFLATQVPGLTDAAPAPLPVWGTRRMAATIAPTPTAAVGGVPMPAAPETPDSKPAGPAHAPESGHGHYTSAEGWDLPEGGEDADPDFAYTAEESISDLDPVGQVRAAEQATRVGNDARAILNYQRAARRATDESVRAGRLSDARGAISRLASRLRKDLELPAAAQSRIQRLLELLADRADQRFRSPATRMLFDLQAICRDIYKVPYRLMLWTWAFRGFRGRWRVPLPLDQQLRVFRHLTRARRRLAEIGLEPADREWAAPLLDAAVDQWAHKMRSVLIPIIQHAIVEGGLRPQSRVEELAMSNLSESLVDKVLHGGHIAYGDLRDEVARRNLKLPDVAIPGDLIGGDRLLRVDRLLGEWLPGVYRPAELYLGVFHWVSGLAFGTALGRWLTRHVGLPFGGSYIALEGLKHLTIEPLHKFAHIHWDPAEQITELAHQLGGHDVTAKQVGWTAVVLLGILLWLLINSRGFRVWLGQSFVYWNTQFWLFVRRTLESLMAIPWIRWLLGSQVLRALSNMIFKPALVTALILLLMSVLGVRGEYMLPWLPLVYMCSLVLVHNRFVRDVQESMGEGVMHSLDFLRTNIFVGLVQWIIDLSRQTMQQFERLLYIVDELVRYRQGESTVALVLKAVFGGLWRMISYVVRFLVVLIIEPSINPVKHFPVVTVAGKFFLAAAPLMINVLDDTMGKEMAGTIAFLVVTAVPGVFGFLAWELKENWRLYAANRSPNLRPIAVGEHGESMLRLMRLGFHSGTLPRAYGRLREALRKGRAKAANKQIGIIFEVSESVAHTVEREMIHLLQRTRPATWAPLHLVDIRAGSNIIRVALGMGGSSDASPVVIELEEQSGWLLARVVEVGWLPGLQGPDRVLFAAALIGFYKKAGVDMVREQLAELLPLDRRPLSYDFDARGLVLWDNPGYSWEAVYPLASEQPVLVAVVTEGAADPLPPLPREQLFFSEVDLPFGRWTHFWDHSEHDLAYLVPPFVHVLPRFDLAGAGHPRHRLAQQG